MLHRKRKLYAARAAANDDDSESIRRGVHAFSNVGPAIEEFLDGFPKPMRPLFRWYDEVGYSADVDAWRQRYPQLLTLEQYLRNEGWASGQSVSN